ncbi:MAG: hypothetical protein JXQ71_15910, partial [Verrucomicrobia bacterium]|nr:hypothetical protein [Verrucomicrobiota bacterium]
STAPSGAVEGIVNRSGSVLDLQAVGFDILVADDVAVLVNTKASPAFVPTTPGVHPAIGLHGRMDEKVLCPFVLAGLVE